MLHTTFNLLKLAGACGQTPGCGEGYDKLAAYLGGTKTYGKDTPIALTVVLDSNGLDDALWCARAVLPEEAAVRDKQIRLLACDYAAGKDGWLLRLYEEQYPGDTRPRQAIEVSRRYAMGTETAQELKATAKATATARAAAWAARAAREVARATGEAAKAAWEARAAREAAWEARVAGESVWQREQFVAMLNAT